MSRLSMTNSRYSCWSESSINRRQCSALKIDDETLTQKKIPVHSVSGSISGPIVPMHCCMVRAKDHRRGSPGPLGARVRESSPRPDRALISYNGRAKQQHGDAEHEAVDEGVMFGGRAAGTRGGPPVEIVVLLFA
eukprot:scaffold1440_cov114-Isochrysis_galbana.AAC.7